MYMFSNSMMGELIQFGVALSVVILGFAIPFYDLFGSVLCDV